MAVTALEVGAAETAMAEMRRVEMMVENCILID
jgi:hypothetical protein